ncbi:putative disease resistance RPP13-like protein 1 [Pistacia vera]|uniref:putative disease resistance RPP13-like protein 1 n=1 Tax=Pistacia vera TaxID=55513 RepID=UPI001262F5A6|nr:putative disease resistance RPP13-like protein 1 [Pistacia vera]
MPVGEAFLSAFLQVLFDRLASREFAELFRGRKYDDLLEKLKITLLSVTVLLNDAEGKQFYYPAVRKWLHMAKDALYDAEDILDKLATEALTSKLDSESKSEANQVTNWRLISSPLSPFSGGVNFEINKIIEKLELIAKYKDVLGLNDDVKGRLSGSTQRLPTTSLVDESCVYGRDNDRNMIIESLLTDDSGSCKVCVVPVVGMGGVGKTTLAQLVYNDSRVEQHFDLRIWVCMSDRFNVTRVITTILSSVTSKSVDVNDLNLLQLSLREKLEGKRFLLVLDDVWSRRNTDWDLIWNPLKTGARGSKIIVTTQDSNIAASMATVPAHHLECLSFEDCLSVFMNHAFENPNFNLFPDLVAFGTEIVKKCEGLPLAAKRLGILLRSRPKGEWYDVLNRKIWDLPDDEGDILRTIGLSYHHLPPHLKQCFAYCSIFPADYEFDKESLVLLWMAEGFVQQPTGRKKLEEIGVEYFDELVSRSFLQQSVHNSSLYVMHGLMKDLAQFVSGDYCFRLDDKVVDGDHNRIFDKARHSSYNRSRREMLRKFDAFHGVECLRTFLPLDPTGEIGASFLANQVPHDLLPKLKYLRVLSFNACRITELPNSVGELKHLRYIDLSRSAIKTLPGSIGTLYNLQTLILVECYSLSKLPTEMGNLTSLRHLRISGSRLREMPMQMCRLTNLQTLSHFIVGKDSGSGIGDLKDIHRLQGALLISGLQNVVSFTDAIEANLKDKKDLTQLALQWSNDFEDSIKDRDEEEVFNTRQHHRKQKDPTISSYKFPQFPSFRETLEAYRQESVELQLDRSSNLDDSRNERIETDVLEMLQPHKNIEELMIKDYGGTGFPSWIGSPLFCNMVLLQLSNCPKCQFLPPLGQLPSLKDLTIEGMKRIKMVGTEFYGDGCSSDLPFPSLETLKFENMSAWEEWSSSGLEGRGDFLRLQSIEIQNCPKLRKFVQHFPSLKKMTISGCEKLEALPRHQTTDSLNQGGEFSCLLELSIWSCPNLMELPTCFPSLIIFQMPKIKNTSKASFNF